MKLTTRRVIVPLTLILCSSINAVAAPTSPMHFNHVSLEDGLTQNNVQSILQDSRGYMWFATENGLNRYDGYGIRQYVRERANPDGLSNDFFWVVAEDGEQNLWLATQGGGVVRWNRATDSFTSFRHDPLDPESLASNDIRTLLVNADGTLWVGTRDKGLDLFDPRSGVARHYRHDPDDAQSLGNDMVFALHVDSAGHLWVGSNGGVSRLNANSTGFEHFRHDPADLRSLSNDTVRTIFEDKAGTLWIGTSAGGLNRLDDSAGHFTHFRHDAADPNSISDNHIRVVFEDDAGRMWVGTADGLNLLDPASGSASRYRHDPANPQSLNGNYINSMFQDRGGLLWVGTRSAGVSKWNPRSWTLGHYIQPWLSGEDVTSFASDGNGTLWVGTLGAGLAKIDESTGVVTRYRHRPGDAASISDDAVMSLLIDRRGALWIGTMAGGLNRLDLKTGAIRTFRHASDDSTSLAADGVMEIFEDRAGQLWIGTYGGGVSVLDSQSGTFRNFTHDPQNPHSLSDPRASAIAETSNGAIWIGTFGGGLNLLDRASGKIRRFHSSPDDPTSLSDDTIYALHADSSDNIWVGTAGGGMDLVSAEAGGAGDESVNFSFVNFSKQDGLPNNVVNGIQSDAQNRLWISTNFGLARFDPHTRQFKAFHRGHGLQGEEFNFAAHHRAADGKLYFGGGNGFNAFYPDKVTEGDHAPNVVLTSYQKINVPVITDVPYDRLTKIDIGYRDAVVNFTFAALDYTAPLQNSFSYMLEGFDDGWNDLGTSRRVTYTNLDPGEYVLKVNAFTSEGIAAANGLNIPVRVAPAPWATTWAYSLYTAFALGLLILGWWTQQRKYQVEAEYSRRLERDVASRTEQLNERNRELQEASRAKSDFLARMSHEIRTPMNGMLGMTQLLMGTKLDDKQYRFGQTIKRSAESLLEIINDILDFSKIEAGRLELDTVTFNLSDLVDETIELFSGAAYEKGIELICSTPPGRNIAAIGDPMRLKQVLVNLIGNAIKFTPKGDVVLRFSLEGESEEKLNFRFEIDDTGVGIHPESLSMIFDSFSQEDGSTSRRFGGTGLGLAICKQLIEMMGGQIGVESAPDQGSCFWFTLSLQKASLAWSSKIDPSRLAGLSVLVVDENHTNRGIISGYLEAFGAAARAATCGSDALKQLEAASRATPYDLILIDADLGDMSGLELARAIRTMPQARSTKIGLLSPAAADLNESEWRSAGIEACLAKPLRQCALYESLLALSVAGAANAVRRSSREREFNRLEKLAGRVLLVEDNDVNQLVALGMLEELGCDTALAVNGKDAIEQTMKEEYDIVLMDCEMPVMDGFAATAAIREQVKHFKKVPIIALTANVVDGDRERCIAAGMQDYLSKPITVEKLHGTLRKWLQFAPDERKNYNMEIIDSEALDSIRNLQGVGGDKMVTRVVNLYLARSSSLVESLREGLLAGDAEAVRQAAHALKSSSQNVGANALARLSQEIEEMGRDGKIVNPEKFIRELDIIYPKTVVAITAVIQKVSE